MRCSVVYCVALRGSVLQREAMTSNTSTIHQFVLPPPHHHTVSPFESMSISWKFHVQVAFFFWVLSCLKLFYNEAVDGLLPFYFLFLFVFFLGSFFMYKVISQ